MTYAWYCDYCERVTDEAEVTEYGGEKMPPGWEGFRLGTNSGKNACKNPKCRRKLREDRERYERAGTKVEEW